MPPRRFHSCDLNLLSVCLSAEPKACGKPEQPPNSTMVASSFNVGATIEYSCDEGHLLVGPATRTCLPTGFYDEFPPVCKSKCSLRLLLLSTLCMLCAS